MFCLHHPTDSNEAVKSTQPNTISKVLSIQNKGDILVGMTIQACVALLHVVAQDLKKPASEIC
jgi:hypothetical protein